MTEIVLPNVRKMFLTDPGSIQFEADLKGADAWVVIYEAEDEELKAIMKSGTDLHCFTGLTEVLTLNGWCRLDELSPLDSIVQFDKGTLQFTPMTAFNVFDTNEPLLRIMTKNTEHLVTQNHRILTYDVRHGYSNPEVLIASEFIKSKNGSRRIPTAGLIQGGIPLTEELLRLLVAVQADGSFQKNQIRFEFHREDKKWRLLWLLKALNVQFDVRPYGIILPDSQEVRLIEKFLGRKKLWNNNLLSLNATSMRIIVEELPYWDGWISGKTLFFEQTDRDEAVQWMHTIAHLIGKKASISRYGRRLRLAVSDEYPGDSFTTMKARTENFSGKVYCPSVPSGFILVKHEEKIFVTGNSHNAEAMWGTAFTSLPKGSHARDHKRQECKHTIHGIHYGCTPRTTAIQRGWTVHEAERFHNRWFTLHPGIRRFQDRVRHALATTRTVYNRFGFRRVFYDRIDNCFTEALAWIPQSTVALCTYHGALQLEAKYWPHQQVKGWTPQSPTDYQEGIILQTHDSVNFQFRQGQEPLGYELRKDLETIVPYDDPLVIPWDLKKSLRSWGEMEKA